MRTGPFPSAPVASFVVTAVLASALAVGCNRGTSGSPTQPSPPSPANVAGTWSGSASDSTGSGQMTWTLTQAGSTMTGAVTLVDAASAVRGAGTISGDISGADLTFTLKIPAGGFDRPLATCATTATGTAAASANSITGSYTGTNTCSGAIGAGHFTLNKQ